MEAINVTVESSYLPVALARRLVSRGFGEIAAVGNTGKGQRADRVGPFVAPFWPVWPLCGLPIRSRYLQGV